MELLDGNLHLMDLEIGNFLYLKYWDLDYLYCDYYNLYDCYYLLNYDY